MAPRTPAEGQPRSWLLLPGPSYVPAYKGWPGVSELLLPAPEVRERGRERALGLEWPFPQ